MTERFEFLLRAYTSQAVAGNKDLQFKISEIAGGCTVFTGIGGWITHEQDYQQERMGLIEVAGKWSPMLMSKVKDAILKAAWNYGEQEVLFVLSDATITSERTRPSIEKGPGPLEKGPNDQ